jgi:predicted  nucleic acid-binding Zn-ribbon protein
LLIVAVLAGAAGWSIGSWSGRDALQALSKAKDLGEQAQTEHDKVVKALNQRIEAMSADFAQDKKKLDDDHARAKTDFNAVLANRDQRIADLGRARSGAQSQIAALQQAATSAPPEDRARLQAEITRLQKTVADQQTLVAGLECSKVQVPAELLAPLRVGSQP